MPENETRKFTLKFNEGTKFEEVSRVEVWCDGREYDPSTESYHPKYSYKIVAGDDEWEYIDNDIRGAANETPDNGCAARSLFAFLYACQEGMPFTEEQASEHENANLFPEYVREWAYNLNDQISLLYQELVEEVTK